MSRKYEAIEVPGVAVPSAASGRSPHFPEHIGQYQFAAQERAQNPKSTAVFRNRSGFDAVSSHKDKFFILLSLFKISIFSI
jgi:hypothetical protein